MTDEMYTAMDMPEGRNQFLKYFDVDVPTDVVDSPHNSLIGRCLPCSRAVRSLFGIFEH